MKLLFQIAAIGIPTLASAGQFEKPVRLTAGGEPISVELPGYAAPCWADVDGDGKKDLLVGQFSYGKIKFYRNTGNAKTPQLEKGEWLKAGGEMAKIPGVW